MSSTNRAARSGVLLGVLAATVIAGVGRAGTGACEVRFNGVEHSRIDSLGSPLELSATDTLMLTGLDPAGTSQAIVRMLIGPVEVRNGSTAYGTPQEEFAASIPLDDLGPYGVGLFRVRAETDSCSADVWVRVSGRFPLATLTGLAAAGLALGGITGQLGAAASRRRWSRSAAALGGIATGVGLALIAQQFGRLQISYPSLAAMCGGSAVLGLLLAWWLNPTLRDLRRERRRPDEVETSAAIAADAEPTDQVAEAAAAVAAPTTSRQADTGPYWCYVLAPTDVFDLNDHTQTIAVLQPGTWYLAKRTVGGWVHIVASDAAEGWVAEGSVYRQG